MTSKQRWLKMMEIAEIVGLFLLFHRWRQGGTMLPCSARNMNNSKHMSFRKDSLFQRCYLCFLICISLICDIQGHDLWEIWRLPCFIVGLDADRSPPVSMKAVYRCCIACKKYKTQYYCRQCTLINAGNVVAICKAGGCFRWHKQCYQEVDLDVDELDDL